MLLFECGGGVCDGVCVCDACGGGVIDDVCTAARLWGVECSNTAAMAQCTSQIPPPHREGAPTGVRPHCKELGDDGDDAMMPSPSQRRRPERCTPPLQGVGMIMLIIEKGK